jgi:hypothetical protein
MSDSSDDVSIYSGLAEDHLERQDMAQVSREMPLHRKKKKVKPKVKKASRGSESKSSSSLVLPTSFNEPPTSLLDSVFMFHGEKGIGKTSLLSQFPGSLAFMFERLRKNLKIMMVSPEDWEQFKGFVELFLDDPKFKFAFIDTLDAAYLACFKYVCAEYHCKIPEGHATPYVVWDAIAEEFGALLVMMKMSGKGLAFISHTKARPIVQQRKGLSRDELEESETVNRLEPTCKPAAFRLVQEIADFVFYYGYKPNEGKRIITVRDPYLQHWVACGLEERFLDPDGTQINSFYVGSTVKQAFADFNAAYENKARDVDYTPPRKTTPLKKKKKARKKV